MIKTIADPHPGVEVCLDPKAGVAHRVRFEVTQETLPGKIVHWTQDAYAVCSNLLGKPVSYGYASQILGATVCTAAGCWPGGGRG